jgi:flagellar biosynthesis chaperone FliJ
MNRERRKQLREAGSDIQTALEMVANIRETMETIQRDEEDYMYNMPENLQSGIRYQAAEETVEDLEHVLSDLEDCADTLEDAITMLDSMTEQ